jgi:hypothetical protein
MNAGTAHADPRASQAQVPEPINKANHVNVSLAARPFVRAINA